MISENIHFSIAMGEHRLIFLTRTKHQPENNLNILIFIKLDKISIHNYKLNV